MSAEHTVDIADLHKEFNAFAKLKPGQERQALILAWLNNPNRPETYNRIPVDGRMQLTSRDPDIHKLLKTGQAKKVLLDVSNGKRSRFKSAIQAVIVRGDFL